MTNQTSIRPLISALGLTFAVSLLVSPLVNAAGNPFNLNELEKGTLMVSEAEAKCGEGKCGEGMTTNEAGSSGGMSEVGTADDGASKEEEAEGKCGEGEGKCGEGKCGG